jgi:hypothetical protein
MIQTFRLRASGLAVDLSDSDILLYMNRVYRFDLPDSIPGFLTRMEWEISTPSSPLSIMYPEWLHSVSDYRWTYRKTGDTSVHTGRYSYTSRSEFRRDWPNLGATGDPVAILFGQNAPTSTNQFGGVEIHPIPGSNIPTVTISEVRAYQIESLATAPAAAVRTQLVQSAHAEAVIEGAIIKWATDYQLANVIEMQAPLYQMHVDQLRHRSMQEGQRMDPVIEAYF